MTTNSFSRSDFSNLPFEDNKKKSFNKNNIQKDDGQSLDGGSSLIDSGDSGLSLEEGISCDICEKVEIISEKLCDMQEDLSSVRESLTLDYDCLGQETIMKQSRDMREEIGNCGEKSICEILRDNDCGLCEIKGEIRTFKEILDNDGECNLESIACQVYEINEKIGECDECESVCGMLEDQSGKLNCIDDKVSDLQTKIGYLKDAFLALNSALDGIEFNGNPISFDSSLVTAALASF